MAASYPKPDAERRTRHPQQFAWLDLPAEGRKGAAPKLPLLRKWSTETKRWWSALWSTPQATAWDQTGESLVRLALLYDDLQQVEPGKSTGISAEMRAIEDRHGLSPKSMLQLRWRIVEAEPGQRAAARPTSARRKRILEVVDGGA
jgi:hypothetical protein